MFDERLTHKSGEVLVESVAIKHIMLVVLVSWGKRGSSECKHRLGEVLVESVAIKHIMLVVLVSWGKRGSSECKHR